MFKVFKNAHMPPKIGSNHQWKIYIYVSLFENTGKNLADYCVFKLISPSTEEQNYSWLSWHKIFWTVSVVVLGWLETGKTLYVCVSVCIYTHIHMYKDR